MARQTYNIAQCSSLKRTLTRARWHHALLYSVLRREREDDVAACPPPALRAHFLAQFNRPLPLEVPLDAW